MANDPAFLFYPGDYFRDTQMLSEAAQVAYDRIMCEHMRNICISQSQLKFLTKRLTEDDLEGLMMVLTTDQTTAGPTYQIPWVADSIKKRRAYSESRRNNRKSKPKKETKSNPKISQSYDKHMENENENENENESKSKSKNEISEFLEISAQQILEHPLNEIWMETAILMRFSEMSSEDHAEALEKFSLKLAGDNQEIFAIIKDQQSDHLDYDRHLKTLRPRFLKWMISTNQNLKNNKHNGKYKHDNSLRADRELSQAIRAAGL